MSPFVRRLTFTFVAILSAIQPAQSEDWGQWRGPRRDGTVMGFTTPTVWPKQLIRKWSIAIGEGHSSPIVVGRRAYVLVRQGDKEITKCIDLENGHVVWQVSVDAPFDSVIVPAQRLGKAPRSTPLHDSGRIYTIGVNGTMSCLAAADGRVIWRKDFAKEFPTPMPVCGASLSPLVDGNRIYVHVGHDDNGAFLALDKKTGQTIWTWKGDGPGYTSPVLATIGGVRQIVTASHNNWVGLAAANGELLWSVSNRQNYFNHNSITPIVVEDTVICGANQRATFAARITRAGAKWVVTKVWETRDVTLSTSSPVRIGEFVYALSEKRRGQIVAVSLSSGKVSWACPGNKGEHASLYEARGLLMAFTSGGNMHVYSKAGSDLTQIAEYELGSSTMWASPAVTGNQILLKGVDQLTLWEVPTH